MLVIKRDGSAEGLDLEKIHKVLSWACVRRVIIYCSLTIWCVSEKSSCFRQFFNCATIVHIFSVLFPIN